jgi:hypothetical protein
MKIQNTMPNYWLIKQNRFGVIEDGWDYGELGKGYNALKSNAGAKEVREGDIVVLMGSEGNKPSFYRGYCTIDMLTDGFSKDGSPIIEMKFSGYTDLNKKPRGNEWEDVKAIKGYNDIRPIKEADKLIFDEIISN